MGAIFASLGSVISLILQLYGYVIVIAVILHLVNADPSNTIVNFFNLLTEPVFRYIRRRLPWIVAANIDFSPFLAYAIIYFLQDCAEKLVVWGH